MEGATHSILHTLSVQVVVIVFALATPHIVNAAVFNCSTKSCLINSINTANGNGVADTINLTAGTYTLIAVNDFTNGENGLPSITSKITIKGAGATTTIIRRGDSAPAFRIFHVDDTGNLTLEGLTIRNGLALEDTSGGGIFNSGTLAITNSIINDSSAEAFGGGISSNGIATITKTTISNNEAEVCGGIDNFGGGTMTIIRSSIHENEGFPFGCGGIGNSSSGTLAITNSTIANNSSDINGGGISNGGTVTIINSTISGNDASGKGGGISNGGTIKLRNTILAENTAGGSGSDCNGSVTSLGDNVIGDVAGCTITLLATDLTGDPGLGTFTDNGTPGNGRFPLLSTSQAIDAGSNTPCASTADQLGLPRVDGDDNGSVIRDIGAIEFGSTPATCGGLAVTILGTPNDNTLNGTACSDVISGLNGIDTISGFGGNDIICGGKGNDTLNGQLGNDQLKGGDGTDTCNGGDGTDTVTSCETITNIP